MTDNETPAETTAAKKPKTKYLIFRADHAEANATYTLIDHTRASNAEQAIKEIVGKLEPEEVNGTFFAMPARSFKPVTITTKQTITLDLKPAA